MSGAEIILTQVIPNLTEKKKNRTEKTNSTDFSLYGITSKGNVQQNYKNKFQVASQNRQVNWKGWYFAILLMGFSDAIALPFLPLFAQSLGASIIFVGIIFACSNFFILTQLLWSRIADKFRIKTELVTASSIGLGLTNLVVLGIGSIWIFLIIRGLQSLCFALGVSNRTAIIGDHVPHQQIGKFNANFVTYMLLGTLFGTLIGGFLLSVFSESNLVIMNIPITAFQIIFFIASITSLIAGFTFWKSVFDKPIDPINREFIEYLGKLNKSKNSELTLRSLLFSGNMPVILTTALIFGLGTNLIVPFLIIHQTSSYNMTLLEVSFLSALTILVQILITNFGGRIIGKTGIKKLLLPGALVTSLFPITYIFIDLLPFYGSVSTFLLLAPIWIISGIGWGLFNLALITALLEEGNEAHRSSFIAIYNIANGLAIIVSPLLAGLIVESLGMTTMFIVSFVVRFSGALILWFYREKPNPQVLDNKIIYQNVSSNFALIGQKGSNISYPV